MLLVKTTSKLSKAIDSAALHTITTIGLIQNVRVFG